MNVRDETTTAGRRSPFWVLPFVLSATLVLTFAVVTGGPAVGSPRADVERRQGDIRTELQQSQESLDHISSELGTAVARLGELQIQLPAARAALRAAEEAAQQARARDAELAGELDVARAALASTSAELRGRQAEARETRREIAGVVRETYRGSDLNQLAILVEATDPEDYADMLLLAQAARKAQDRALARLEVQQAEIRSVKARQQAQEDRLEQLKAEAEAVVAETAAAEEAARRAQEALQALVDDQAAMVAQVEAAKVAEEERLAELSAESAALQVRLAEIAAAEVRAAEAARQAEAQQRAGQQRAGQQAPSGGTRSAPGGDGALAYPVNGRITSPFGYRFHPILRYQRLHTGIDFGAPCGTPIYSAADGTVVSAGWAGGYGNQIVVSHGVVGGVSLASSYNHLSEYQVRSGSVSKGQLIGYVGTTGLSTGCHLHFETREAGVPVDPMRWL
jgi:murein DD-endopeptidase MepM/ murein hydrolase activator NlpD